MARPTLNLTEEERRRRRNEASLRCYRARKARLLAEKQGAAAQPPAAKKTVEKKTVNPAPAKQPEAVKLAEKLVKKFAKAAAAPKTLVRECGNAMTAALKSGDPKTVDKVARLFKQLGVETDFSDGKAFMKLSAGVGVRVPKSMLETIFGKTETPEEPVEEPEAEEEPVEEEPVEEPEVEEEPVEEEPEDAEDPVEDPEPTEVPVDPETAQRLADGEVATIDQPEEDDQEEDDQEEDDPEDEEDDEERDPDFEEDTIRGRGDYWKELEAMGVGEDD